MSIARSTPLRAAVSESGRAISPSTTSTFGSDARVCAFAGFRTRARDEIPFAESRRTSSDPFSPVAPVTRITSAKVWNPGELQKRRRAVPPPQLKSVLPVAADAASRRVGVDEAEECGRRPGAVAACRRGVAEAADRVVDDQIIDAHVGDPCLIPT